MWKNKNEKRIPITEILAETAHIPSSVHKGDCILSLSGNHEVWIENYKGILEYGCNCIVIQGNHLQICLKGKNLEIMYYTNDEMKITGQISCIQFV